MRCVGARAEAPRAHRVLPQAGGVQPREGRRVRDLSASPSLSSLEFGYVYLLCSLQIRCVLSVPHFFFSRLPQSGLTLLSPPPTLYIAYYDLTPSRTRSYSHRNTSGGQPPLP